MIKNYLKVAWRNLLRHKVFSLINLFGFAVGLASCLIIFLYTSYELNYDTQHPQAGRIYRICVQAVLNNNRILGPVSCAPLAGAMRREIPEILNTVRVRNFGFPVFRYGEKAFSEERVFFADASVFELFPIRFIKGNPRTALAKPENLVITRSMAEKYFGAENPIGKTINSDRRKDYVVSAVIEDSPGQTHFHYDFIGSLETYKKLSSDPQWLGNNFYTYVLLKEGASPATVDGKLAKLVDKYAMPMFEKAFGVSRQQLLASGAEYHYFLQPLQDIHLRSHMDYEMEPNGDIQYVYLFSFIGLGIFLMACINFINLTTARSATRAREVGVRKTLGSDRWQLIRQFLTETLLLCFIAIALALVIIQILQPQIWQLTGKKLLFSQLFSWKSIPLLAGLLALAAGLAGGYPSFYLASFQPVAVLKGQKQSAARGSTIRNLLVIFQFTVSIGLIFSTLVVNRQMNYIQEKNLGFNKDQILVIKKTDDLGKQLGSFMEELKRFPAIQAVCNTSSPLGGTIFGDGVVQGVGQESTAQHIVRVLFTDEGFVKTYQVKLLAGRFFANGNPADQRSVILNETAVRELGLTEPVGKQIVAPGDTERGPLTIIGVVRDFHFQPLQQPITALLIGASQPGQAFPFVSVRLQAGEAQRIIAHIDAVWRRYADKQALEYAFLDDMFAKVYQAERQTATIMFSFAILAIVIACLGLLGLSLQAIHNRTKEIGIRKILGASVSGLCVLIVRNFLLLVAIANGIAWLLAYYLMTRWLENFAYRTSIGPAVFIFSALLAFSVAILTVGAQTIHAASANPVDSLRYE